jgi:hypothetical protein
MPFYRAHAFKSLADNGNPEVTAAVAGAGVAGVQVAFVLDQHGLGAERCLETAFNFRQTLVRAHQGSTGL